MGTARVEDPGIRWRLTDGPFFDNQVATLKIRGRHLEVDIEKTIPGEDRPTFEQVCHRHLT
jgi:hypothetical protein